MPAEGSATTRVCVPRPRITVRESPLGESWIARSFRGHRTRRSAYASRRPSHRDARRAARDRAALALDYGLELRPEFGSLESNESEACVVRRVPWHVTERGQGQARAIRGRGFGLETVDQGRPQAPSCVFGRDADLLDMGPAIDELAQEVRHRPIPCVHGDPRVSGRDERLERGD